jgi:hypothetical protein
MMFHATILGFGSILKILVKDWREDWYNWRVQNWGTKWCPDSLFGNDRISDTELSISFDSAWAPPIQAYVAFSKLFPDATFVLRYLETGCCFAGCATIEDGIVDDAYGEDDSDIYEKMKEYFGVEEEEYINEVKALDLI